MAITSFKAFSSILLLGLWSVVAYSQDLKYPLAKQETLLEKQVRESLARDLEKQRQQNNLPKTEEELKIFLLNMTPPEEQKSSMEQALENVQHNLKEYLDPLVKKNILPVDTENRNLVKMASSSDFTGFVNCLDQFALNPDIKKIQGTYKSCTNYVNRMKKSDWDRFVEAGIKTPENFKSSILAQLENVKKEMDKYNKPDEVVIVNDFFTLDEVEKEDLALIQEIDPTILDLSQNVQGILVNFYSSPSLESFVSAQTAVKDCADDESCSPEDNPNPVEGIEELIEFTQILNIINDHSNPCWTSGKISELQNPGTEISSLTGRNQKKESSDLGTVLLGVEGEKGLNKIDGYKYTDGDKTYYIYHGKKTQLAGDIWVMAEVSPEGVMDFKYFRLQNKQEAKVNIVGENNISLVKSPIQNSITPLGKNGRLFFQSQQGLIIQGSRESAPLIGHLIIPKNKIIIAQVSSVMVHPKVITQTNMSFTSNSVDLNLNQRTIDNKWAAGVGVRWTGNVSAKMKPKNSGPDGSKATLIERIEVSPIKQTWQLSTNIRVTNLTVGYSDNFQGNRSASISYVAGRNYVGLSTNLDDQFYLYMGRQFKNDRGGIIATTNFKDNADVKMIFFLTKKQPVPPEL